MIRKARALALLAVLAAAVCAAPQPPEVRCFLRPYIYCAPEAAGDGDAG